LKDNILPDDSASAYRIAGLAKRYTLEEGDLYQCGTNGVLPHNMGGGLQAAHRGL
jgi:hypothetical protein